MYRALVALAFVFVTATASAAPARPASDLALLDARYHFSPAQKERAAQLLACYQEAVARIDGRGLHAQAQRAELAQRFRQQLLAR